MRTVVLSALTLLLFIAPASADIVMNSFILNNSFESPSTVCCSFPTGWNYQAAGSGDAGNYDPVLHGNTHITPLDGSLVAYVNNYSGQNGFNNWTALSQTVNVGGMVSGETYTLRYGVARRFDLDDPAGYRVQINGGGGGFAITSGSTAAAPAGTWLYRTVSYTATAADTGLNPTIYLVNDGRVAGPGVAQVNFDVIVPEASALPLLAAGPLLVLALARRRRRAL